nr:MAG TPA: hypothetical protein [Caudoviricetes sp.]
MVERDDSAACKDYLTGFYFGTFLRLYLQILLTNHIISFIILV